MTRSFQYQSKNIFYAVHGKGKAVVLLHGFGEDSSVWNAQVDFLKENYQLIVPDLPGTKNSERLAFSHESQQDFISIEDYADCIHALLMQENIASCIMLGHSMGGYITLAFAEKYGHMLAGFGLIHSTAYADSPEKKKTREKSIETIEQYGSYAFLKNTTPNLFSAKFKAAHPEKVKELIDAGTDFSKESLQQYTRAMMLRPDRTKVLLSNRVPVIFVTGTEDIAAPLADVIKQASLPYISYIHVLQETGHMGMLECPELLNQYLLHFLTNRYQS